MKIGYKPICEVKINSENIPYYEFLFLVIVNGYVVCATKNENFAIRIVNLYIKIEKLYKENIKFKINAKINFLTRLLEKEREIILELLLEEERALFEFLLKAEYAMFEERKKQERVKQERQEQERQEQERQEQERQEQERQEQERQEQEQEQSKLRLHP